MARAGGLAPAGEGQAGQGVPRARRYIRPPSNPPTTPDSAEDAFRPFTHGSVASNDSMMSSSTAGSSRVHAHSPAGLRLALLSISERSAEKRRSISTGEGDWEGVGEDNVVISHPPR